VNAKVVAGEFERELRGVRDWRSIAGAVPCRADAEEFRERLNLARRTQASDLRNVDAYEIDQPVLDQWDVFMLRVEQFAIASGVEVCCRRILKCSFSSGGSGSSRKKRWCFSTSLQSCSACGGVTRS